MKEINSKIAGISLHQGALADVKEGEELVLKREPSCAYDRNAVKVLTAKGAELGYVKRQLAFEIAPIIDAGIKVECFATQVTGLDKKTRGVNILLKVAEA
ncbi:MAG: HIRAN domain-containing protein [Candidatus Micrarchaeota archaeon]